MRFTSLALALAAALLIGACGDKAADDTATGDSGKTNNTTSGDSAGNGPALDGAGWDGGDGAAVVATSEKYRIVQFLKPT